MQLVSTGSNYTAQAKTPIEQRQGLSLRPFIRFFLPDQSLNLLGQQTTNGSRAAGGKDSHLLEGLAT
jgi:hypothetical protein